MENMAYIPRLLLVCALTAVSALAQADWTTAEELPGVDFAGLTAAQKKQALDLLRTEICPCGCNMHLAECRIADPPCRDSRALSEIVLSGLRNHRTAAQIHDDLVNSPIWKMRAEQNRILGDPVKIHIGDAPSRGPANAPITLVEFSDFECPYCSVAAPQLEEVLKSYPKDIRFIFKQFPLEMHAHALMAAEASLAAGAQGKFWEMYQKLFANSRHLSQDRIYELAKEVGLDMTRFSHDMETHAYIGRIKADLEDGEKVGVYGTPMLFINGKPYRGPIDIGVLAPIFKDELNPKHEPAPPQTAQAHSH